MTQSHVRHDFVSGSIPKTLIWFALPTLGSIILQSLNGSINTIWVGRLLGANALAATANANVLTYLAFAAVFGFGMAATILISQSTGRGDIDGVRRAFGSALSLVIGGAIVLCLAGWLWAPVLLRWLGTPVDAMPLALPYLRVTLLATPSVLFLLLLSMGMRGTGDSLTPFWFTLLGTVIDAGLNPFLILGLGPFPRMGIAGSAMATLISTNLSLLCCLAVTYWKDLPIRLRGAEFRYLFPDQSLVKTIITKGPPMGAQMIIMSFVGMTMLGLLNKFGTNTVAAFSISQQLWTYIQMPAVAVGGAVSTMAAHNIGAGRWDRVNQITCSGLIISFIITTFMVATLLLLGSVIFTLFVDEKSPVIIIAIHIHRIVDWGFVLFGMAMILFATVRANGAVWTPLLILLVAMFPVRVAFATYAQPFMGVEAIWWSYPLGAVACFIMAAFYYLRAEWRKAQIGETRRSEDACNHGPAVEQS